MNYLVLAYSIYLPIAVALTIWVAKTLHANSKVFFIDIFHGQQELAVAVNKLLQVGFYLISLGYAFVRLKIDPIQTGEYDASRGGYLTTTISDYQQMIETLSVKVGGFILILGLLLFINLLIVLLLRSSAKGEEEYKKRTAAITVNAVKPIVGH